MSLSFVMLGPPASGKGTQGRNLADHLAVPYLSTGASLRQAIQDGTPIGLRAQAYLDRNEYIPDELAIELVEPWVFDQKRGWVLDGFPRSISQAEALVSWFGNGFRAIHLDVPNEELLKRVSNRRECLHCKRVAKEGEERCPNCGREWTVRADDSREGILKRIGVYERFTLPVLDFLMERGQLLRVDGCGDREAVWQRIVEKL